MKTSIQIIIVFLFVLSACSNDASKNDSNSNISVGELRNNHYQEVIAIHDEVMPKMQNIISLQERIIIRIDSLTEVDTTLLELKELSLLNSELASADKSMMDWMHQFNSKINSNDVSDEVAIAYLEEQKIKILEVKEVMNNSIYKATEYLGSHQ